MNSSRASQYKLDGFPHCPAAERRRPMSTSPVCHERRAAQRFDYQLPISIKVIGIEGEVHGCTQDLSARGAFFYTEAPLTEGSEVEVTLLMPAEITLTASMPVRCRGKVLRVARQEGSTKIG